MSKVLNNLSDQENRKAQFRTVIALIQKGEEYLFEGECKGEITCEKSGAKGFGYDPIFKAEGFEHTFAEMSRDEKGAISHRGMAVAKLVNYLNS